jgi:hypothetical protein
MVAKKKMPAKPGTPAMGTSEHKLTRVLKGGPELDKPMKGSGKKKMVKKEK